MLPFPFVARFRSTPALSSQRRTVILSAPIRPAISETDDLREHQQLPNARPARRRDGMTNEPVEAPSLEAFAGRTGAALRDPEAPGDEARLHAARAAEPSPPVPRG